MVIPLRVGVFLVVVSFVRADFFTNFESFDVSDSENKAVRTNSSMTKKFSHFTEHPSWKILTRDDDIDCGESSSDRIIGGKDAALGQFPWMARLGYITKKNSILEFKCGGSLISDQYVLTAAHCIRTIGVRLVAVRLGDFDTSQEIDCVYGVCAESPQDFTVSKIMWHRGFNNPPMSNDIGLLKLNGKANFNDWVLPICLPTEQLGENPEGTAEVAGWGITDMFTNDRATILQSVSIPLLPISECQKFYKNKAVITDNQICAGGNQDEDSCGGDSGGPLMKVHDGGIIPQYYVVGLVSFGPSTCGSEAPAVYTSVFHQMTWILDNMET